MSLSYEEFSICAKSWSESSSSSSSGIKKVESKDWEDWDWIEDRRSHKGYLRKVKRIVTNVDVESDSDSEFEDKEVESEAQIETSVTTTSEDKVFELELHAVYSETYRVPVMYFKIRRVGLVRPLPLRLVQVLIPKAFEMDNHNRSYVTQEHHPLLGTPFFCLHPCQTVECLKIMLQDQDTKHALYLLSWYSAVISLPLCLEQPLHCLSRVKSDLICTYRSYVSY